MRIGQIGAGMEIYRMTQAGVSLQAQVTWHALLEGRLAQLRRRAEVPANS